MINTTVAVDGDLVEGSSRIQNSEGCQIRCAAIKTLVHVILGCHGTVVHNVHVFLHEWCSGSAKVPVAGNSP